MEGYCCVQDCDRGVVAGEGGCHGYVFCGGCVEVNGVGVVRSVVGRPDSIVLVVRVPAQLIKFHNKIHLVICED